MEVRALVKLLVHVGIIVVCGLFVVFMMTVIIVDMVTRVDFIKQKFPWLGWLERKASHGPLLLVCLLLLIGNVYELYQEETPEAPKVTFPSPDQKDATIAQLKSENSALKQLHPKIRNPVATPKSESSDDPEISLSCVGTTFPIKIPPDQDIEVALLIPGIKSGLTRVDNRTKFPRLWPSAQTPIGQGGIRCDAENHGDINASVNLTFITYFMQASPPGVQRERNVRLEPLDAKHTRTFYLANWCQNFSVTVVIPQTAKGRFLGEDTDQERGLQLLGNDHGQSIGLGDSSYQNGSTCN